MQKLFITFSRAVFVSGILTVLFFAFGFGVVMLTNSKKVGVSNSRYMASDRVVLGSQNVLADSSQESVSGQAKADDARPLLVKKYLTKYKSPLLPYADLIVQLSDTYKFDYYWILAIGQQESNLCKKIPENSHNCWGYGINSAGTLKFDNYELALKSYAEYLKREYFDKGRTTPEQIMKKYCPHSNGSWAFGVKHFIEEIETGNF